MQNLPDSKFSFYNMADTVRRFFGDHISKFSSETIGWVAILCLHGATIPSLLALMTGLTDTPPPVDLVLLVWSGLTLMFIRAAILKDMLNIFTIGIGFILQAVLMMLVFFK